MSARYTGGLMRALDAAGDRSGALARARLYRETVHRELNADPDPAIQKLEAVLRAAPAAAIPVASVLPGIPPGEPGPAATPPHPPPAPVASPPRQRIRALRLASIAVAGVVILGLGLTGFPYRSAPDRPFLAVGTIRTPELGDSSSLGPVMRDMLATSLGGLDGVQVVANSRLVELTPPALASEPGVTADAARRAGATEIIEGELITEGGLRLLTLRRVDLTRGVVRRGYVVRAPDRYSLVDSATAAVARDLGVPPPARTVRDVRTSSDEAYTLYSEGLRAFYRYDSPAAYRLMTAALERDSSFAMAAYYAWSIGRGFGPDKAFERVKRLAPRTIERERLLIQAATARVDGPNAMAAAIAETLTVRYPTDPDGQMILGEARFNQGDWAAAIVAYQRAVAIDSAAGASKGPYCRVCVAIVGTIGIYLWWDSAGAAERAAHRLLALRPDDQHEWGRAVEPLLRQGRRAEAELAVERSGASNAAWIPAVFNRDLIRWGHLEDLDRNLIADLQVPSHDTRVDASWLLLLSLRDQGRLQEWLALVQSRRTGPPRRIRPEDLDPQSRTILLLETGRPDSAARVQHAEARRVLAATDLYEGVRARIITWHLALAATAYVAAGETARARRLTDSIEVFGKRSQFGRDPRLHHFVRGLLHQREGRHLEAVEEFRRSIFSITDGYTRANLELARSLLVLKRPAEAIAVLRPAIHGGVDGSNSFTSRTELHEAMAEAFELAGQTDSARAHYAVVERNWRRAGQAFRDRYLRAKVKAGL